MIDTYTFIKNFTTADNPEKQAEITAKFVTETFEEREGVYKHNLASKSDLRDLELRLVKWFAGMLFAQGAFVVAIIAIIMFIILPK